MKGKLTSLIQAVIIGISLPAIAAATPIIVDFTNAYAGSGYKRQDRQAGSSANTVNQKGEADGTTVSIDSTNGRAPALNPWSPGTHGLGDVTVGNEILVHTVEFSAAYTGRRDGRDHDDGPAGILISNPIPEPRNILLLGIGLAVLAAVGRRYE